MSLLAVENLRVSLPLHGVELQAVRGVDFELQRGETVCIVGESGCGKSMTALALMGLLPPRAKRRAVRLDFEGVDLTRLSRRRMADLRGNRLAMIFQEPMTSLNPVHTVGQQLTESFQRHRRGGRAAARERALHLLARVGIPAAAQRLDQYPHQLSGGLRQRVMIAMSLMCEPDLLIADEPTTALDVTIQAQILHLLAELRREFGLTLLLITHDLGVVARVADRVLVMYAGEIVEAAPVAELFARPRHPYTRALLNCVPVPGKTPRGEPLGAIPGRVPSLIGGIRGCAFRERCAHARAGCKAEIPERQLDDTHRYRCLLPPEKLRP